MCAASTRYSPPVLIRYPVSGQGAGELIANEYVAAESSAPALGETLFVLGGVAFDGRDGLGCRFGDLQSDAECDLFFGIEVGGNQLGAGSAAEVGVLQCVPERFVHVA